MKKTLIAILLLHLSSLGCWQYYANQIKETRSTALFEAGRHAGKHEMQLYLFDKGVKIPDIIRVESLEDVRGDHWTTQERGYFQLGILAYFPALGLAGIVALALLILAVQQPPPRSTAKTKEVEQGGTGQPATRSQLKSEGSDKPQFEAEGRSR